MPACGGRTRRSSACTSTDCYPDRAAAGRGHQALAQSDMFRPVVKFTARLERGGAAERMSQAIEAATDGPVHLDVSVEVTAADGEGEVTLRRVRHPIEPPVKVDARRPVLLIGLAARTGGIAALCERFRVPALVTYKAKGVVPDRHPWFGSVFTNGALEREILECADAFVAVGLNEVELLPRPWTYAQPIISRGCRSVGERAHEFRMGCVRCSGSACAWNARVKASCRIEWSKSRRSSMRQRV
jgi:acetolactate synthase I/II/III large subunit